MSEQDRLGAYRAKRDFGRTREPSGSPAPHHDEPRFVVQIHDARRMHFDFRLQVGDVLKSWSVPRGPSTDPRDKRLAVPTEDHPLQYEEFEGVIPKGEYGGGTVIVWDHGTYEPLSHDGEGRPVDFAESLERGHATFRLHGTKLHGEYALTSIRGQDGEPAWLLVRKASGRSPGHGHARGSGPGHGHGRGHGHHGTPDPRRARSVRTGRTLAQVAADGFEGTD